MLQFLKLNMMEYSESRNEHGHFHIQFQWIVIHNDSWFLYKSLSNFIPQAYLLLFAYISTGKQNDKAAAFYYDFLIYVHSHIKTNTFQLEKPAVFQTFPLDHEASELKLKA